MGSRVEVPPGLGERARRELTDLIDGLPDAGARRRRIAKSAIRAPDVLNEAQAYDKPAFFSRGMRVELPGCTMLFLSGTASVDERGATIHDGDFDAQCLRTFRNLSRLLAAERADWRDVVRTTCYLRDIERDYDRFNELRSWFLGTVGLDPLPASTGIQARLCRTDLLVEIEMIAITPREDGAASG
ncbi:MAG TPA: Rid family hydrolase [Candidatus Polarisedimenticolaceae bacterium]|nr:Rid family hydrolase [Candidatus Polarisedimenticolaceae bacterium]